MRVVITGLGIVAPNAHGLEAFEAALRNGESGIRFFPVLKQMGFGCQVGGEPQLSQEVVDRYVLARNQKYLSQHMLYALIAALDCWQDADLKIPTSDATEVDFDTSLFVGTGVGSLESHFETCKTIEEGRIKEVGRNGVLCGMMSASAALISGQLHLGGHISANSSACITGLESIILGYQSLMMGQCKRALVGSAESGMPYAWGGFDALRVLNRRHNEWPEKASRPMSASSGGFVPSSGSGMLLLEELDSALMRGARIYGEIIGTHMNSGGQCNGGSLTNLNPIAAKQCLQKAILQAGILPSQIDFIAAHLPGTGVDPIELDIWQQILQVEADKMPWINSTKSLLGHGLGAAGSMEMVAASLQLHRGFVHGSRNCEDLHPKIEAKRACIVQTTRDADLKIVAKSGFGFGDVNGCIILRKYES